MACARDTVLDYHHRTTHRPGRYARSLGYMDWETQPDPFRSFPDAPRHALERGPDDGDGPPLAAAFHPATQPARPVDRETVSRLLYDSLALSAWKAVGRNRWSLRCNPSSGNLHPTEGYVVAGPVPDLHDAPAVYHYAPFHHALERVADLSPDGHRRLLGDLPAETLLVGLTSIHWRESWKYGERAFRYCQHDVGHAAAAVAAAAALLGWEARMLPGIGDADLAKLLGIAGQTGPEAEHPDLLLGLWPAGAQPDAGLRAEWQPAPDALPGGHGYTPAALSPDHHPWTAIERVATAAEKPAGYPRPPADAPAGRPTPDFDTPPARQVIRQRRSAVDMDGETGMAAAAFEALLEALLPAAGRGPHRLWPWRPAVHPVLFVHRVEGLTPGTWILVRDPAARADLEEHLRPDYQWTAAPAPFDGLPLYRLTGGDQRNFARQVSCAQDIASDGAFAVALLAELGPRLEAHGPWLYRALHWEAGALGQVLYLQAEAAGLRGTGIGCFFDDEIHRALGITGPRYRSLYNFTIGAPVDDPRLSTLPPYFHLS